MTKDHLVFKEKISFSPLSNIMVKSYHAQLCLFIETGSQVSDVAHGPLVVGLIGENGNNLIRMF